jgi:hypothetical protein
MILVRRTDVSEEHIAFIFSVKRPRIALSPVAMKMKAIFSSEPSVFLARTTRRHTPEDNILED